MKESSENNAFKKLIPKEQLTAKDKEAVLKTIETAKLILEAIDLVSVKHVQTRMTLLTGLSDPKFPKTEGNDLNSPSEA